MKILHYALGFPPYRTGGLTKYCIDLMLHQVEKGDNVGLIWPGEINPIRKLTIKKRKSYKKILNYEIINPLLVALDEGVLETEPYMRNGEYNVYDEFFKEVKPDILHIHTLMGLHKELIIAAKNNGVKTIFTTHDYYGLCPKVTFFRKYQLCEDDNNCKNCVDCNKNGLSQKKILLMQSPLYRVLKNSLVLKWMRKRHRQKFFNPENLIEEKADIVNNEQAQSYRNLRKFYVDILELIDIVHFNSSISEAIYKKYVNVKNGMVIPITHNDIKNNKMLKQYDDAKLSLTYLAPTKPFKGYGILKDALDELWKDYPNKFELRIYDSSTNISPYMIVNNGYKYSELKDIFEKTDVLLAPSVWYETYGFTVLEALSYGVPVIVSNNVGTKDLIDEKYGFICESNKEDLKRIIESILLNKTYLKEINKKIVEEFELPKMSEVSKILYN